MADIESASSLPGSVEPLPASNSETLSEPLKKEPPPHYALKAGDVDTELNKTIREIVLCTEQFIVYIDTEMSIQWRTTDDHQPADYDGEVLNQVTTLEARSGFLKGKSLFDFRKRIAEGLARCLEAKPKEVSMAVLKEVDVELKARNKEVSWRWYFLASYCVVLVLMIVFGVSWLERDQLRAVIGTNAFEVILGAICGGLGALLFATARGDQLGLDANAGLTLHCLEGLARIGAGLIGALLFALAIKAGLILGGAAFPGNKLALLLCFCIVAGASERLVPSLITTLERTAAGGNRERSSTKTNKPQLK